MLSKDLVNSKNTAVLVVDLQNDYCSEKGKVAKIRKLDVSPMQTIFPKISKLLDRARAEKIPVIWTRMIEDPKYMAPNAARKLLSAKLPIALCTPGTWGFGYYKIKPERGDFEIIKKQYDAFSNPKLQQILKKNKITNLIILGVYTAVCVDTAVRSAHRLGYNVIVPKDLVAMPKQRQHLHKAALENMEIIFAYLTTSIEIEKTWKAN